MDRNLTTIKERILQIAKYKGFTNENFCEKIGVSYSTFKGQHKFSSIGSEYLATILTLYEDISPDWLILGKGSMLRSPMNTNEEVKVCNSCKLIDALNHTISIQAEHINDQKAQINDLRKLCKL